MLLLLEEMDQRTVMCQVGEGKGLVQRCHMKVITPLAPQEAPQVTLLHGSEFILPDLSGVYEEGCVLYCLYRSLTKPVVRKVVDYKCRQYMTLTQVTTHGYLDSFMNQLIFRTHFEVCISIGYSVSYNVGLQSPFETPTANSAHDG